MIDLLLKGFKGHEPCGAGVVGVLVRLLWPKMRKRSGRLGGKGAFGTPLTNDPKHKGLGSSREVFGNVSENISLLNSHALLKGQQTTARRALGDITNATPQRRPQQKVQAKAAGCTEAVAGVKPLVSIS